jgi:steroid delta-isomerase-like uncharacterized protein
LRPQCLRFVWPWPRAGAFLIPVRFVLADHATTRIAREETHTRTTTTRTLIHQWVEAGDAGDFDAVAQYLHADVVIHTPLGATHEGLDALNALARTFSDAVPDMKHEIQEVVSVGDTLAARIILKGTHRDELLGAPATGNAFHVDQAIFAHLRDGKIAEVWEVVDTAALMQQIGAMPSG